MDTIICTCGTNIGSWLPAISEAVKTIKEEYLKHRKIDNVPVDNIFIHDLYDFGLGALLDAFGFPNECCRTNILARDRVLDKI